MCVRNINTGGKKKRHLPLTPPPPPPTPRYSPHCPYIWDLSWSIQRSSSLLPSFLPTRTNHGLCSVMQITILQLLTEKKDELRVNAMALIKRNWILKNLPKIIAMAITIIEFCMSAFLHTPYICRNCYIFVVIFSDCKQPSLWPLPRMKICPLCTFFVFHTHLVANSDKIVSKCFFFSCWRALNLICIYF